MTFSSIQSSKPSNNLSSRFGEIPEVYYPISRFYQEKFGEKVYKVSVSVSETCPNRQGKNGMTTCIFCDEWGSAAYHLERELDLSDQIQKNKEKIKLRYKSNKFLVYFQSYTNTFVKTESLRKRFDTALSFEDVVGFVVGTRPDCLPLGVIRLLEEYSQKSYVQIELGAQSFDDAQLEYMKRGHDSQSTLKAVEKLSTIDDVDIGIHLIFGWPNETVDDVIKTAHQINGLPVSTVKLHNLHVLKNTVLHEHYLKGQFTPLSLEQYTDMVSAFLSHLRPDIAVHRLAAVANRREELIAPNWTMEKMRPTQFIKNHMRANGYFQGMHWG